MGNGLPNRTIDFPNLDPHCTTQTQKTLKMNGLISLLWAQVAAAMTWNIQKHIQLELSKHTVLHR
jgi:hypothetical protein